jgi:hypothetical protein
LGKSKRQVVGVYTDKQGRKRPLTSNLSISDLDRIIINTEKHMAKLKKERGNVSKERRKLLDDLKSVELYIANQKSRSKRRRAIKKRQEILEKLRKTQ